MTGQPIADPACAGVEHSPAIGLEEDPSPTPPPRRRSVQRACSRPRRIRHCTPHREAADGVLLADAAREARSGGGTRSPIRLSFRVDRRQDHALPARPRRPVRSAHRRCETDGSRAPSEREHDPRRGPSRRRPRRAAARLDRGRCAVGAPRRGHCLGVDVWSCSPTPTHEQPRAGRRRRIRSAREVRSTASNPCSSNARTTSPTSSSPTCIHEGMAFGQRPQARTGSADRARSTIRLTACRVAGIPDRAASRRTSS